MKLLGFPIDFTASPPVIIFGPQYAECQLSPLLSAVKMNVTHCISIQRKARLCNSPILGGKAP